MECVHLVVNWSASLALFIEWRCDLYTIYSGTVPEMRQERPSDSGVCLSVGDVWHSLYAEIGARNI